MSSKCKARTKKGRPCKAYSIEGSDFCQAHEPSLARQRAKWRKEGGKALATPDGEPVTIETVSDITAGLAATIGSTWKLKNTPQRNRCLCQLYLAALKTFEIGEMEERMNSLEQRIDELSIAA